MATQECFILDNFHSKSHSGQFAFYRHCTGSRDDSLVPLADDEISKQLCDWSMQQHESYLNASGHRCMFPLLHTISNSGASLSCNVDFLASCNFGFLASSFE